MILTSFHPQEHWTYSESDVTGSCEVVPIDVY